MIAITPSTWCTCNLYKYNKTGKHVTNCKKVRIYASLLSSLTKRFLIIIIYVIVCILCQCCPSPKGAPDGARRSYIYNCLWFIMTVFWCTRNYTGVIASTPSTWCDCKYTGVIAITPNSLLHCNIYVHIVSLPNQYID